MKYLYGIFMYLMMILTTQKFAKENLFIHRGKPSIKGAI